MLTSWDIRLSWYQGLHSWATTSMIHPLGVQAHEGLVQALGPGEGRRGRVAGVAKDAATQTLLPLLVLSIDCISIASPPLCALGSLWCRLLRTVPVISVTLSPPTQACTSQVPALFQLPGLM